MFKRFFAFVVAMIMMLSVVQVSVFADTSDYTGKLVYKSVADKTNYDVTDGTIHVDFKMDSSYLGSAFKGLNNTTFFVSYNPKVVKAVKGYSGDVTADYTTSETSITDIPLITDTIISKQLALTPNGDSSSSDFNEDYENIEGADGTKTAAELGYVKIAANFIYLGTLLNAENDGTLFGLDFEILGKGDADIRIVGLGSSGEISANGYTGSGTSVKYSVAFVQQEISVTNSKDTTTETSTSSNVFDFIPTESVAESATIYNGTKAIVEAVQALHYKTGDSYYIVNGRSYLNYLQTNSVNTLLTTDGTTKKYRISVKITAKEDTTIRIDHKVGSSDTNFILKGDVSDGGTAEVIASKSNDGDSSILDTFTVPLNAGDVIYFAGQGENPIFYAIDGLGESATNQSTTTTTEATTETTTSSDVFDFIPTEPIATGDTAYNGTKAIVEAVQALSYKSYQTADIVNSRSYFSGLQTNSVNTNLTVNGETKYYRVSVKITAKEDTTIRIDHKVTSGKTNFILKGDLDSGTAEIVKSMSNDGDLSIYDTFTVSLNAGDVIYFASQGTNPIFYAIDGLGKSVDSTTASTTQATTTTTTKETSTESTTKITTSTTKETSTESTTKSTTSTTKESSTESTTKTTTSTTEETSTESTTQSPDGNIDINITSKKALRGDYVDIPVAISNNPGICYFNIWINYDKTKLQPVSYTKNPAFSTIISNIDNNINNGSASFLWNDGANAQNSVLNGNAFTIKFLVLEDAEVGESALSVNTTKTEFYYPDLSDCGYTYTNGSVNITNVRKGDINLDGKINIKDLLVLTQYNAGWIDTLTNDALDAADVTGDGKVNGADLIILSRYLAGWVSVTL